MKPRKVLKEERVKSHIFSGANTSSIMAQFLDFRQVWYETQPGSACTTDPSSPRPSGLQVGHGVGFFWFPQNPLYRDLRVFGGVWKVTGLSAD